MEKLETRNSLENLEFVVPLKRDTNKTPFCMFSKKDIFKNVLQDNNRVRNSVMKPVHAVEFRKIKKMREGNNDKSNNFETEIIYDGVLDNAL